MSGYAANAIQTGWLQATLQSKGVASLVASSTSQSSGLWVSLHVADPAASGAQNTSETTYGGYLRVELDRSTGAGGWSVSGNSPASASPNTAITFAQCSSSTTTISITNFSVGTSSSGAGTLWFSGPLSSSISVTSGITPSLTTGTAITLD